MTLNPFDPPDTADTSRSRVRGLRFFGRLFEGPTDPASPSTIVAWWELRRVFYNLTVFTIGVPFLMWTLKVAFGCGAIDWMDRGKPEPFIAYGISAIVYGLLANVCFTGGWIVHLLLNRVKIRASRFATIGLIVGTSLSIIITTICGVISVQFARELWCGGW